MARERSFSVAQFRDYGRPFEERPADVSMTFLSGAVVTQDATDPKLIEEAATQVVTAILGVALAPAVAKDALSGGTRYAFPSFHPRNVTGNPQKSVVVALGKDTIFLGQAEGTLALVNRGAEYGLKLADGIWTILLSDTTNKAVQIVDWPTTSTVGSADQLVFFRFMDSVLALNA